MPLSGELREKLILIIGNLIARSIEEARNVPYILRHEDVVELLVRDPHRFQRLIEEERLGRTEYSTGTLTARLDAVSELGHLESLDGYDVDWNISEKELSAIIRRIDHLTRTFAVYVGNAVTLFEREFELFSQKLRDLLRKSGMGLRTVKFSEADMTGLEHRAHSLLSSGEFLKAFLFERLVRCQVITKEAVVLPSGYSISETLIRAAVQEPASMIKLVRFILRAGYISQGNWHDLFSTLVRVVYHEGMRSTLLELIGQDMFFCCNLLCRSLSDLSRLTASERMAAIERALDGADLKVPGGSQLGISRSTF